jgi:glycosyltransferase involved in cell wall biosynthesis
MTRIAIVSPTILPGDAVGHDILHMWRVLSARGHEVELFSTNWGKPDPRNQDDLHVRDYLAGDPSAVLILHHAIGWVHAVPVIREAKCRRVVKYHNVTPERFYQSLHEEYAQLCHQGRTQLRELIDAECDCYLADSPYNLAELIDMGADAERCVVTPPFNDIGNLLKIEPDSDVLHDYSDGRANLLFVGRRAPNKGHRLLIDAFAVYHTYYNPASRLVLLGKGDSALAEYTWSLREQVRRHGLTGHVVFLEVAAEAELRAYYQTASALVVASEHEGFCVPVVEAMALGVPVVAYGTTAVPHTLGDAGLVWDEPDPFLLAQSIDTVVRDGQVRQRLIERGQRRYRDLFANERIEQDFLHALEPLLEAKTEQQRELCGVNAA